MNLFNNKNIKPMLIGADKSPFDDPDYIYEIKWDGERCIAYLDFEEGTELRNKRNIKMLPKVPELDQIHKQARVRCILDGELMVLKNGKPDFYEIQRRSLMTNSFKIDLLSKQYPATFIAFDILYFENKDLSLLPLAERKRYLKKAIVESDRLAISRYIENQGKDLYNLTAQQGLEGIVSKRKDSIYIQGKRTKDWIKIKNMLDDDFVVCGYIFKDNHMTNIVLGQYSNDSLIYKGHVILGVNGEDFRQIQNLQQINRPPFDPPDGNEAATWVIPTLVCTVKFMEYTSSGGMRQPVFKGLRFDKIPTECINK